MRAAGRVKDDRPKMPAVMPRVFASGSRRAVAPAWNIAIDMVISANPKDDLVEHQGAKVWVAPEAVLYLLGTRMDFEVTTLRSGFTFNNPNQTSACGCGESVELKPADLAALAGQG